MYTCLHVYMYVHIKIFLHECMHIILTCIYITLPQNFASGSSRKKSQKRDSYGYVPAMTLGYRPTLRVSKTYLQIYWI